MEPEKVKYSLAEAVNTILGLSDYQKELGMHNETFLEEIADVIARIDPLKNEIETEDIYDNLEEEIDEEMEE